MRSNGFRRRRHVESLRSDTNTDKGDMSDRTLMNVQEAAEYLQLSAGTVYSLCADGLLSHCRVGLRRGRIQITKDQCDAYIDACEVPARPPRSTARPKRQPVRLAPATSELDRYRTKKKSPPATNAPSDQ